MCDLMQEEVPSLNLNVCSLIKSFFETLTADQLLLLVRGNADESTETMLRDLILQIIKNFSAALQTYISLTDIDVTKELVDLKLSNVVIDSFKEALEVTTEGISPSAEAFRDLMSEEVLLSALCSMTDSSENYLPAPTQQRKMVNLASDMIKTIKRKSGMSVMQGTITPVEDLKSEDPLLKGLRTKERFWYDTPSSGSGSPLLIRVKPYTGKKTLSESTEEPTLEVRELPFLKKKLWNNTTSQDADFSSQEEKRRNAVLMVMEKLVSLMYLNSEVISANTEPWIIIDNLMRKTWAEVEDIEFDPSAKTFSYLEEDIFKALVNEWGNAETVLAYMRLELPELERFVIGVIKDHLTSSSKKRCSCVCRFFSCLCRTIAGFCKRRQAAAEVTS